MVRRKKVTKKDISAFERLLKKVEVPKEQMRAATRRVTERSIDHFGLKRVGDEYKTDFVYIINEDEDGNITTEFEQD